MSVGLVFALAIAAGFVGAMSGMGGGIVLIPALTRLGVDIKRAIAVSIVNLGIAVLLLTPYARVGASMVMFAIERNWKYVTITAAVLAVLTYSLFA